MTDEMGIEPTNEYSLALEQSLSNLGHQPEYSAEELLQKMGYASSRFEVANQTIKQLNKTVLVARAKARTLILAKKLDLLQNRKLANHLATVFEDTRYKPSVSDLDEYVYLEAIKWCEPFETAKQVAKDAIKEYELWQGQLMWYMSKNKLNGIEIMSLGQGD